MDRTGSLARRLRAGLGLIAVSGVLIAGLPPIAHAAPNPPLPATNAPVAVASAAPPAFAVQPISGFLPDEEDVSVEPVDITSDGARVLYQVMATGYRGVLAVRDRVAGTTSFVDHRAGDETQPPSEPARAAAISADGSVVVFASGAYDLDPAGEPDQDEAFLRRLGTGALQKLPRPAEAGAGFVEAVDVSADGGTVAVITGQDWRAEGIPGYTVYVVDADHGTVRATKHLPAWAGAVTISADGSTVAYAADTSEDPEASTTEVVVADAATLQPMLVRNDWSGTPSTGALSLDGTGSKLVYRGAGDTALVVDRGAPDAPVAVPVPTGAIPRNLQLSADGRTVVYDDAKYDEGGLGATVWSVTLPDGAPVRVAGTSPFVAHPEQQCPEDPCEEGPSPYGTRAVHPAASADGSVVALWLDGAAVVGVHSAGAPDTEAPTWPDGAQLTAAPADADTLRLSWPAASDDRALRAYELTADGRLLTAVAPSRTDYEVTPAPRTASAHYAVRPIDTSGNAGAPLDLQTRGPGMLVVDRVAPDTLQLDWEAPDRSDVTGYRVLRAFGGQQAGGSLAGEDDFAPLADVPAGTTRYTDPGLPPLTHADYRVQLLLAGGAVTWWTASATTHTDLPAPGELTITDVRSNAATLSWSPAASSVPLQRYRIARQQQRPVREFGWTDVATVGAGQPTTYTDTGLAPRAQYLWRVLLDLDNGWGARDWTAPGLGSTAGEGITAWTVDAPRTADGAALVLGSGLVATVAGEPGLQATLRLWQSADPTSGQAADVTLPLREDPPGTYRTDPYLLDGLALTAIGKAEVTLTDGARVFTRAGSVGTIGGRLELAVAAGDEELPSLELVLRGAKGTVRQSVGVDLEAAVPLSPGTWEASLVTADGDVVATRTVTIAAATATYVSLTPVRHALLTVTVLAPPGRTLEPQSVVVTGPDGAKLASKPVPVATGQVVIMGLPARTEVVVGTLLADPKVAVSQPHTAVRLGTGGQSVQLRGEILPAAEVKVVVTSGGYPLPGARVSVAQRVDDRSWTFTGTAGGDGTALVAVLAGAGDVTASADRHLGGGVTVSPSAGSTVPAAIDLLRTPQYVLQPHQLTTNAGAQPVEQPMEWITAAHLRVTLTVGGRPVVPAPAVPVVANEGDLVEFCADGWERALGRACVTATLGADAAVPLRIELTQAGAVTARLQDAAGKPVAGWWATSSRVTPNGSLDFGGYHRGTDASAIVGAATAGQYQIVFASAAGRSTPITVGITGGSVIDLGTVTLSAEPAVEAGASLAALPEQVLPGGRITYRITLPATIWPNRTELRAAIPAGTTAPPQGVTVDGAPVAAQLAEGVITIPLAADKATVVRYVLDVDPTSTSGPLASTVRLVYGGGARIAELGSVLGVVAGVTLSGPRVVSAPSFRLTGSAPSQALVTLTEDGIEIGTAVAGAGGRWTATVTLPAVRRGSQHTVVAAAVSGGARMASAPITVGFDDRSLQPVRVDVDNSEAGRPGARVISFDPALGAAAFTMVYRPGVPVGVTAVFTDATRVRNYVAHVGAAEAAGRCDATSCTAVVRPDTSSDVGDIWVDYDVDQLLATSVDDVPMPTVDQLRHTLTPPFNDPRGEGHETNGTTHTFNYQLGGTGVGVRTEVTISSGQYAPTARDSALQTRSGVPVNGLTVTGTDTADGVELRLRGKIPQEFLRDMPPGAPLAPNALWHTTLDIVFKLKAGGGITVNQLHNLFGTGKDDELYAELRGFIRENIEPCSPEQAEQMYGVVDFSRITVGYYRGTSDALNVLGLLGGSWTTMGEGLVKLGAETAIGEVLDLGIGAMTDDELAQITKYVKDAPKCDKRIKFIPREFKFPVAKPTWIYDPSGFVFQALESQRLSGVTTTVLHGPSAAGPWTVWDAAAFGQTNPQTTGDDGRYGWDVPAGWWKIRYAKDGFRPAESDPMQVLPEHYGVDVDLHPMADPRLTRAEIADGGIALTFDMWMQSRSVASGVRVNDVAGHAIAGVLQPIDGRDSPRGVALAREFRFVPNAPLPAGAQIVVTVAAATADHGGIRLGVDAVRTLTVPGEPEQTPGQRVLAGFDTLVAEQRVKPAVAGELRAILRQVIASNEAGRNTAARLTLVAFRMSVLVDVALRRVTPAQGKALTGFAETVTRLLRL